MTESYASLRRRFQITTIALIAIGITLVILAILRATGGMLIYSLDDPYIHLSLAENLLHGHYGINPGETASPSSSILYPFLLAAGLGIGLGSNAALVINVLSAFGAGWILSGLLFDATTNRTLPRTSPLSYVALVLLLGSVSIFALPLTGMEHMLHVYVASAIIAGLARMVDNNRPDFWLILAIFIGPLLRFEGLALSGAALLMLALRGQKLRATLTGGAIVAALASYVVAMKSLGLPPLPSSVMVKSSASAAAADSNLSSLLNGLAANIAQAFTFRQAFYVAGMAAALLVSAVLPVTRRFWPIALTAVLAALAHIVAGRWGWFGRYEVYVVSFEIAALLIVFRPVLTAPAILRLSPIFIAVLTAMIALPYVETLRRTPGAARWVHGQQYQMHRFATEFFPATPAVNDLGWVSYQNENYVLDLWGLGSEEARTHRANEGLQPGWVRDLAVEHNAAFAMVFDHALGAAMPSEWCRIAQMDTKDIWDFPESVAFYLADMAREDEMRAALAAFEQSLPESTTIEIYGCAAS